MEAHGFGRRGPDEPVDYLAGLGVALTAVEHEQLVEYESSRQSEWNSYYTVGRMIEIWRGVAPAINGDHWNVDDYTLAFLSWRDRLETVLESVDEPLRKALAVAIEQGDEAFRSGTDPDERGLLGLYFKIEDQAGWWWRRLPKKGLIRNDLERAGQEEGI